MKTRCRASRFAVCIALLFWAAAASAGWRSTLSEEFDGSALNTSTWNVVLDTYGDQSLPNNNELECYIPGALGVADSTLTITALHQQTQCSAPQAVYPFSSGVISSFGTFYQEYGYFEMRAKIPPGQGMWPAFWLLPNPQGWPPEIDVMEEYGNPQQFSTTYHWDDPTFGHQAVGTLINTADLSADFHTYGVDWQPGMLVYYLDGTEVFRVTLNTVPSQPMFLLANLAVKNFGVDPANDTFPQNMLIDYIHAYVRDPSVPGDDSLPPGGSPPANVPNVPVDILAINFATRNVTDGNGQAEGQGSAPYSGNAWALNGPAFIEQLFNFSTATSYQFTVEAATVSGAAVTMSVDVDGQSVATTTVNSATLQPYVLDGTVPAGLHNVAIRMQNPASGQTLTLGAINIRDPSVPLPPPSGTISVSIFSPQNGTVLTPDSWTTISGAASGGTGIEKVQYYIDGNLFCTALSSPYNCSYDPSTPGTHTLMARAIDTSNTAQETSVTYQVGSGGGGSSDVTVTIWAPTNGQVFNPNFFTTFTAIASGNNPISTFDFSVDGIVVCGSVPASNPTNCSYQTPASGTHTLTVVATDSMGETGQQTAAFSVSQSSTVSVTIWAPSAGQTFSPGAFTTLTAIASGNNPISKFDFYVDGSAVCSNVPPSSPTNCSYQVPATGTHTVQVVATDNTNATGQSSVQFSVQ